MPTLLLQAATIAPDDCIISGLCGLVRPERPVAPGVMFLAVALVATGVVGLRRRRVRGPDLGDHPQEPSGTT